ncbi:PAS domain-containing protein [Guyparkeria sp. GHLCS8-2]|uniref:PAS domain S-box protein n=1 Tax=Guyparkeria halopsychrophila TaxID=3139421 RepID=UPI0037CB2E49
MTNKHGDPNAENHELLRQSARNLIEQGVAPRSSGGKLTVDALRVLFERARDPESAADALKLLHELQTYQVELDLLYEQLQANEHELSEELARYRSLYEQAPAAYLIVANDGEIIEGNEAAGVLFGSLATDLADKALGALLAPGQEGAINALLSNLGKQGPANATFELADRRQVTISARSASTGDRVLLILTEATTHSATS